MNKVIANKKVVAKRFMIIQTTVSSVVECLKQGVEPFDFTGSGSVWVEQLFQISVQFRLGFRSIERLRFRFAPVKITSKPVYKVPVRVRSIIRKILR